MSDIDIIIELANSLGVPVDEDGFVDNTSPDDPS